MWIWLRKQLGIDRDVRLSMNEYVRLPNELQALRRQVMFQGQWLKNIDTVVAHIERAAASNTGLSAEDVRKVATRIRTQIASAKVALPSSVEEILKDERSQRTV
jgi:hypothetical protein